MEQNKNLLCNHLQHRTKQLNSLKDLCPLLKVIPIAKIQDLIIYHMKELDVNELRKMKYLCLSINEIISDDLMQYILDFLLFDLESSVTIWSVNKKWMLMCEKNMRKKYKKITSLLDERQNVIQTKYNQDENTTWIIHPGRHTLYNVETQLGLKIGWLFEEEGFNIFSDGGLSLVKDVPHIEKLGCKELQDGDRVIMFHCGDNRVKTKDGFACSNNALYSIKICSDCSIIGAFNDTIITYRSAHVVFSINQGIKVSMKRLSMIPKYVGSCYRFQHDKWCVVENNAHLFLDDCSINYDYNGILALEDAGITATNCAFEGQGQAIAALESSDLVQIENCYISTEASCGPTGGSCIGISKDDYKSDTNRLRFKSNNNYFKAPWYPMITTTKNYQNKKTLHKITGTRWNDCHYGSMLIEEIQNVQVMTGFKHDHKLKHTRQNDYGYICECLKCEKVLFMNEEMWYCCVQDCRYCECNDCW